MKLTQSMGNDDGSHIKGNQSLYKYLFSMSNGLDIDIFKIWYQEHRVENCDVHS